MRLRLTPARLAAAGVVDVRGLGGSEAQSQRPGLSGSGWLAEVLIEEIDERAMAMRALRQ